MKRITINDEDRRQWVLNYESLYRVYLGKAVRMSLSAFVKLHRADIDAVIRRELNKKPAGSQVSNESA